MLFFWYTSGKESYVLRGRALSNQFSLQGERIDIQKSGNRSFGILLLKLDHVNTGKFVDTLLKEGIFPCKIKDGKAEIYQTIPFDAKKEDRVTVESDKKGVLYRSLKGKEQFKSSIGIITERIELEYVKGHTVFK